MIEKQTKHKRYATEFNALAASIAGAGPKNLIEMMTDVDHVSGGKALNGNQIINISDTNC